eukprot:CAMPEP_0183586678 /NCGR_PEP_ID=MMETSP0371-20130417/157618_1 /TAXON_ID=268820 /ORGANISM="Peridinium aciculiferum, Strain PAER-2" /LENGTH=55 /DNA_ID=CAMNT_0025797781 /DNA_START=243 /DNA_END=407 /DNA_ORIENTATION=-
MSRVNNVGRGDITRESLHQEKTAELYQQLSQTDGPEDERAVVPHGQSNEVVPHIL